MEVVGGYWRYSWVVGVVVWCGVSFVEDMCVFGVRGGSYVDFVCLGCAYIVGFG